MVAPLERAVERSHEARRTAGDGEDAAGGADTEGRIEDRRRAAQDGERGRGTAAIRPSRATSPLDSFIPATFGCPASAAARAVGNGRPVNWGTE